ncbi:MAG: hypothetical protein WC707_03955 [Candidatus Babeliaceae bacterium]
MKLLRYFLTIVCLSASFQGACAYDIDKLKIASEPLKYRVEDMLENKAYLKKYCIEYVKADKLTDAIKACYKQCEIDYWFKFLDYCYITGDQNDNNIKKTKNILTFYAEYPYITGSVLDVEHFDGVPYCVRHAWQANLNNEAYDRLFNVIYERPLSDEEKAALICKDESASSKSVQKRLELMHLYNKFTELYKSGDDIIKKTRLDSGIEFPLEKKYGTLCYAGVIFYH